MAKRLKVEVFPQQTGQPDIEGKVKKAYLVKQPEWYWRIRWENGRIAATSEGYEKKATAARLARKMADMLRCDLELPIPAAAR